MALIFSTKTVFTHAPKLWTHCIKTLPGGTPESVGPDIKQTSPFIRVMCDFTEESSASEWARGRILQFVANEQLRFSQRSFCTAGTNPSRAVACKDVLLCATCEAQGEKETWDHLYVSIMFAHCRRCFLGAIWDTTAYQIGLGVIGTESVQQEFSIAGRCIGSG